MGQSQMSRSTGSSETATNEAEEEDLGNVEGRTFATVSRLTVSLGALDIRTVSSSAVLTSDIRTVSRGGSVHSTVSRFRRSFDR